MVTNNTSFGTRGNLTLDISIAYYIITPFSLLFYIIYSTGKYVGEGMTGYLSLSSSYGFRLKQRAPYRIPHCSTMHFQSTGTAYDRRFYGREYGALFDGFYSRDSEGGQGRHYAYLMNPPCLPCHILAPKEDDTAKATTAPPSRAKPCNLQYLGWPWLWPTPSHPGHAD